MLVAPGIALPSSFHWISTGAVPETVMENRLVLAPHSAVRLVSVPVKLAGTTTVRVATLLVTEPAALVTQRL